MRTANQSPLAAIYHLVEPARLTVQSTFGIHAKVSRLFVAVVKVQALKCGVELELLTQFCKRFVLSQCCQATLALNSALNTRRVRGAPTIDS
jgi:hypothetical protein